MSIGQIMDLQFQAENEKPHAMFQHYGEGMIRAFPE